MFYTFLLLLVTASWVWGKLMQPAPILGDESSVQGSVAMVMPFVMGGGIAGLILADSHYF